MTPIEFMTNSINVIAGVFAFCFAGILLAYMVKSQLEDISADKKKKRKAKEGSLVLLTADQYFALNQTDPEKYPLDKEGFWGWQKEHPTISFLNEDFCAIWHCIDANEECLKRQEKEEEKERVLQGNIDMLCQMQRELGSFIDEQNTKNVQTAKQAVEQAAALSAKVKEEIERPISLTLTGEEK